MLSDAVSEFEFHLRAAARRLRQELEVYDSFIYGYPAADIADAETLARVTGKIADKAAKFKARGDVGLGRAHGRKA